MRRRRLAVFLLALAFFAAGPAAGLLSVPARAEAAEKTVTLMVYMCGSNLESSCGAATADLMEMASSGYDAKKINLLVMTGGTSAWQMGLPTDALCVYVPFRNTLRMVYAFESMSMGSPEALSALLAFGAEKYPADEYALILWNHGGGPMNGICWDELYGADRLTMEELCSALAGSPFSGQKLSWIGFDACLMASAETAFLMSPFADYMIASEETEPAGGWNYSFLKDLEKDPDAPATAHRIIDSYFTAETGQEEMTLSCVDLSRTAALSASMDAFFEDLEVSSGNYAWFSYAARNTRSFGKAVSADSSYDLMDLAGLVRRLEDQAPEKAEDLRRSLSEAVIYSRSGSGDGQGLSVYHPFFNRKEYAEEWGALYPRFGFSSGYSDYIGRFSEYLLGKAEGLHWEDLRAAVTEKAGVYALPLSEAQREMLSSAVLRILRWDAEANTYTLIATETRLQEEDGVLYTEDPGRILVAEDAAGNRLTGALPYEILPDGTLAVYVNFCRGQAVGSAEAGMLPDAGMLPGRKGFGSYSFEDSETGADSMNLNTQQAPDVVSVGSGIPEGSETETGSLTFWEEITPVLAENVSPLSGSFLSETLAVPDKVSFALSLSPDDFTVTVRSPGDSGALQIEPSQAGRITFYAPEDMILNQTGSEISLDSFVAVEVSSFQPAQVEVSFAGYDPESFRKKQAPDLIHARLIVEIDENGSPSIREIALYEPLNGEWSARVTADLSDYPVLSFPVSVKQPTRTGEALAGFGQWEEVGREPFTAENTDLHLRFVPDPEGRKDTCVLFEITDIQCAVISSLPVLASP